MQREWAEEPLAVELWEALQVRRKDRQTGTALLTSLADRGSALAMMYLGHAHVKSEDRDQVLQGEEWLARSAAEGSIEGRFQLACHYERQGAWEKIKFELETLAAWGYSPAMYDLGRLIYRGELGYRDVPRAIGYLKGAINAGHLPSLALLSQIYRKEQLGVRGRIAAHWLCLKKFPAVVRCVWSYPSSDRLRPFGRYSNA